MNRPSIRAGNRAGSGTVSKAGDEKEAASGGLSLLSERDPEWADAKDFVGHDVDRKRQSSGTRSALAIGAWGTRDLAGAALGALLYLALASLSLSLSSFNSMLATVWLPSAAAIAFLLRARLNNEVLFYAGAFLASLIANIANGSGAGVSAIFSVANMANVALVTWLIRSRCGSRPDMSDLSTLMWFAFAGGVAGPVASLLIAMPGLAAASGPIRELASSWILTESMGMILVVPTALLVCEAIERRNIATRAGILEVIALLALSAAATIVIFSHETHPLLFLIAPITVLHAVRLGSLGTALHVGIIAVIATMMTWAEFGPIHQLSLSAPAQIQLIQAFIGANFLIGLPVAAILAGQSRLALALSEGQRELTLLAENITDAVLKIDRSGVCTYASPSVRDVLGREPEEFLGKPIAERTHEESTQRIDKTLNLLLSGQSEAERLTYRRLLDDDEGLPVFIEADCAVALDRITGEHEGVVVCARDVTERVELELLLTRARRRAENAATAKSDFLANMSHEIRTPMNGVLGFAELMLQGKLEEEQRRYTEMIVQSGRSMMLLLNDILDLSKIEAGQIVIDKRPIDICATLEECVALHRPSAAKKGLHLTLSDEGAREGVTEVQRAAILTDGLRLRQIVLNLLSNAVKFTENGAINVSYRASDGVFTLSVNDSGIGISDERMDSIFSPFTQAESDTARRYGGTGLGLSISRQLAELLGGTLEVKSVPGEGSTFTLSIPARQLSSENLPAPSKETILPEDIPQHARILLAEDHDVNRELATEMLERCGQNVEIAADGNEAISMVIDSVLRAKPFDLVLMDIQMPGCDGYAATRAIRDEGIGPNTLPILALTANAFPEDIRSAREAGMQGHLSKPLKFGDLAKALARWLPTRIVEAPMDRDVGDPQGRAPTEAASATSPIPQSASLTEKWIRRRGEAIELVREALQSGALGARDAPAAGSLAQQQEEVVQQVHKLAGTAATFGEAELGEQAARLERALRLAAKSGGTDDCEEMAFRLLALADEPGASDNHAAPPSG